MKVRARSPRSAAVWAAVAAAALGASPAAAQAARSPYTFPLAPPSGKDQGRGQAVLVAAWSPFGVAVTIEGHERYELQLEADGLAAPATGSDSVYVAWAAKPDLSEVRRLGVLRVGHRLTAPTDWAALLVVVSREGRADLDRWRGPIVLRGFSRAALLTPLSGHSIFNRPEL